MNNSKIKVFDARPITDKQKENFTQWVVINQVYYKDKDKIKFIKKGGE